MQESRGLDERFGVGFSRGQANGAHSTREAISGIHVMGLRGTGFG